MKLAVIPWAEAYGQDRMFDPDNRTTNRNQLMMPYIQMRREFEKNGDAFHTVDCYPDLSQVDYFLFFDLFPEWILKLVKMGYAHKMIYCNAEPEPVQPLNCPSGYEKLKKYFPYLMTWNEEWVDDVRIFKRIIPYYFGERPACLPYGKKKLLTNVSGNKHSDHPRELYSERERLISFFESRYPSCFDLYGTGWEKKTHPSYQGAPEDKFEVYARYRFAISLENTKQVKGYVTEKIFDCLMAGVVPIYQGAEDICRFVPGDCFIDYSAFHSMQELADFLIGMPEEEYEKYQRAIDAFLAGDIRERLDGAKYARNLYHVIRKRTQADFTVLPSDQKKLERYIRKSAAVRRIRSFLARCVKRR